MPHGYFVWGVQPPATFRNGAKLLVRGPVVRSELPDKSTFLTEATKLVKDTGIGIAYSKPNARFSPDEVVIGMFDFGPAKDYVFTVTLAEVFEVD